MLRGFFIVADERDAPRKQFRETFTKSPTGEADMKSARFVQMAGLLVVTTMLGGMGTASAQTATAPSSMKTIGASSFMRDQSKN